VIDYRVDEVSLDDRQVEKQVEELIVECFGIEMPEGRVRRNTAGPGQPAPLYVAAVKDGAIIGFNAFIGHRFVLEGEEVLAYQSCWTATSSAHRGKKIFQNLILAAHDILARRGAAFVFGFPNSESHPIFVRKLGYREMPSVKWQMPNLQFARSLFLSRAPVELDQLKRGAFCQDDRALIALKRNESVPEIRTFEHEGSLCWGVSRQRVLAGVTMSYVDVGGIDLAEAGDLPIIIAGLQRQFPRARYVQLVSIAEAPYNRLFKRMAPSNSNVLIVHDLNGDSTGLRFNFFGGVRDVY
jgi:predicted N-acetyltransferase YhbS